MRMIRASSALLTTSLILVLTVVLGVELATCGEGHVGNGICVNSDTCCSSNGWCDLQYCHGAAASPTTQRTTPILTTTSRSQDALGVLRQTGQELSSRSSPLSASASASSVSSSEQRVLTLTFPDHATGDCSKVPDVMAVNLGYYQSWSIWREPGCNPVTPEGLDVAGNGYTHVAYSFASIDANFRLEPYESNYEVEVPLYEKFNALKQQHPDLKTLVAIGGWTFNNPGATEYRFSDTARTAENRATFAASCLDFLRLYNFDGLDIDWEFPGDLDHGGRVEDKENLVLMMQAIRDAFDEAGEDFIITVATPVSRTRMGEGFDFPSLLGSVDFFHLMTYNIYSPSQTNFEIGANTDMPYIFRTVDSMLNATVPPSQIVLGLAAYGRTYVLADPLCATAGCSFVEGATGGCGGTRGFMPYFTIEEYLESGKYQSQYWNPKTGTAELFVDENLFISYDDQDSYALKNNYATRSCFRGVMWWAADMKKAKSGSGRIGSRWHQWLLIASATVVAWSWCV